MDRVQIEMLEYRRIYQLSVKHSYYKEERCTDLLFKPGTKTQGIISGHRLMVKYRPDGLCIFAPIQDGEPLIQITEKLTLAWIVSVKNKSFWTITALPAKDPMGSFLFSEKPLNKSTFEMMGGLQKVSADNSVSVISGIQNNVRNYVVELGMTKSKQSFALTRKPDKSTKKVDFKLDSTDASVNAWDAATNRLEVKTAKPVPLPIQIAFPVPHKAGPNAFASLQVNLPASLAREKQHQLYFHAKKIHWRFFVVLPQGQKTAGTYALAGLDSGNIAMTMNSTPPSGSDLDPEQIQEKGVWLKLAAQYPTHTIYLLKTVDKLPLTDVNPPNRLSIQYRPTINKPAVNFLTNLLIPRLQDHGLQIIKPEQIPALT